MTTNEKLLHGTPKWFDMVGTAMRNAALQAELSPDVNVCLVERYTNGIEFEPGLVQGLRFEIIGGTPSFTLGVRRDERGDITVEVTTAASHKLNTLHSANPEFGVAFAELQAEGEFKVDGDLSALGSWFTAVHDQIVDRTF
jgi:hypothetical protein